MRNLFNRKQALEKSGAPSPLRSDAFLQQAMNRWGDSVYRIAITQTGSPVDADDIYQDVFLRLLKDTTEFASDDHLKAWLLRVTVNRCHDLARTAWNRRTGPLEREQADLEAPEAFNRDIWETVSSLPEDRRAVVHLHYFEGYSTDEIAHIMQCKPSTVRTRLYRAREQLRELLEADNPDDVDKGKEPTHDREQRKANLKRLPLDDTRNACAHPPAI